MREPSGHITVNERLPSNRFTRFVDEKIKNWMKDHHLEDDRSEYEVAFFNEDTIGEISCLVVIHAGNAMWRSWETADNPQLALRRSIERLEPESAESGPEFTLRH
jgi:hypothetical protein